MDVVQIAAICTQHAASPALLRFHGIVTSTFTQASRAVHSITNWTTLYSDARDTHMADTAAMLVDHLKSRGIDRPKIVICALFRVI